MRNTTCIRVLGCIGCWACIILAAVFYGFKPAALVALAILLEAIIAATIITDTERECDRVCAECERQRIAEFERMLRDMEDDGK